MMLQRTPGKSPENGLHAAPNPSSADDAHTADAHGPGRPTEAQPAQVTDLRATPSATPLPQIVYSKKSYQAKFQGEREKLLQAAFKGLNKLTVETPLSGYSGAQTWRVSTEKGQVFVVKLAHPTVIEREYQNHQEFVASGLHANAAHPADKPFVSPDGQWALLKSTFVRLRQSRTLLDYIQQKGSVDIATILKDIFREHGHWWWGNAQRKPIQCSVYYDRLLPEHLRVDAFEGSDTDALVLEAGEVAQDDMAELESEVITGHKPNIYLEGFRVERIKDNVFTVCADPPKNVESPKIRIKLTSARRYTLGETISVYAKNLITRRELLNRYARDVLPSFSADSETFIAENSEYPNPIPYLQKLLDKNYDARVATIHGDLNLSNVLVDMDENNERYKQHWLIDFAATGEGPVLLDLQWLEGQVITWLLAPAIQKARQSSNVLQEVFDALHSFKELPPHLKAPLQTPYTVLQEIRRLVRDYYLATPNHWDEYYRGLVIALLGAMRHEEALDLAARQVAFLSAATIIRWTEVLPSGLDRLPTSRFSRALPASGAPVAGQNEGAPTKPVDIPIIYVLGSKPTEKQKQRLSLPLLLGCLAILLIGLLGGWVYQHWSGTSAPPSAATQTPVEGAASPIQNSAVITIGIAIDRTDKESLIGDDQQKGADLAEAFFNQQAGVNGQRIKFIVDDTSSSVKGAEDAFNDLINSQVIAIIGPTLSKQAQTADKLADQKHVPVIAPSNTAAGIPELGCYVSRVSAPASQLAPLAVSEAYKKFSNNGHKVAIAYAQNQPFTRFEAAIFTQTIQNTSMGFQVIITQTFNTTDTTFTTTVENLIKANPDLVIISGLTSDSGKVVKTLRESKYPAPKPIIGGNGFSTTGIFQACGAACQDVLVAQAYSSTDLSAGNNQQFVEAYRSRYHSEPSPIAAQMFTAVQVVVEALRAVNQRTPLASLDLATQRKKLNQQLLSGQVFQTPLGEISLAPNGELVQNKLYVAQIQVDASGQTGQYKTIRDYPAKKLPTAPSDCTEKDFQ